MRKEANQSGLTLIELLVAITIFGIIMGVLYQVLGHTLAAYEDTRDKQNLLSQAHYAIERMVMFVQQADEIAIPADSSTQILEVSERVLDTFGNLTHVYRIDGDGLLDADNDSDGLVNEGQEDIAEYVSFRLDTSISDNWKLIERRPDYSTEDTADKTQWHVICEHVTNFSCRRFNTRMVEIHLTLEDDKSRVGLKTRAKARHVD